MPTSQLPTDDIKAHNSCASESDKSKNSRDIVTQPPTEHVSPKKGLFATLSALAAGFALLLWVFMRQAWRNTVLDPQAAPKLARLRAALGWHN